MGTPEVFLVLAMACGVCAVVSAVLLTAFLDRRGIKTPIPLMGGFLLIRNLGRYKEITLQETGRVGLLFHAYVVPINAALVFAVAALAAWILRF